MESARTRRVTFISTTLFMPRVTAWIRLWCSMKKASLSDPGESSLGLGIHVAEGGSEQFLYLSDYAHGIVTKRTLKGEEVFTLGYPVESSAYDKGHNNGPVNYQPTNVAIAPNGDFYVADGYGSSYINQYNKDAQFIRTFGVP